MCARICLLDGLKKIMVRNTYYECDIVTKTSRSKLLLKCLLQKRLYEMDKGSAKCSHKSKEPHKNSSC